MEIVDGMTPDELRKLADEMDGGEEEPKRKTVKVRGVEVTVDMRAVEDVRTIRMIAEIERDEDTSGLTAIRLFDFLLGDQAEKVQGALADDDGYCSAKDYAEFCAEVMKAVGAKN